MMLTEERPAPELALLPCSQCATQKQTGADAQTSPEVTNTIAADTECGKQPEQLRKANRKGQCKTGCEPPVNAQNEDHRYQRGKEHSHYEQ